MKVIKSMDEIISISSEHRRNPLFDTAELKIEAFLLLTLDDGKQVKVHETDSNIHRSGEPMGFYEEKEKGLISQVFEHDDVYLTDPYYDTCCAALARKIQENTGPQNTNSFSLRDYGVDLADFDVTLETLYADRFNLARDVTGIILRRNIF